MKMYLLTLTLAISISFLAKGQDDFETQKKQIENAHQNIEAVKQNFRKALQKAVSEKGVQGAIGECKITASELGVKGAIVEIGRTSHKLRNPLNKPRDWIKPVLEKYTNTTKTKHEPYQVVQLGSHHFGYVEPIYVEAVCLNCHGTNIRPEVRKEISQLYPQDSATGFKVGEFRGLIWLESKAP